MNALELLKTDHEKVSSLFEKCESASESSKKQIFTQIKNELDMHTELEETIFYPALEQREELKDLALEAYEEHRQVKTLLREIENLVDGSDKFDAKLKVLKDNVEHHVEEEESEMFTQVERIFPASQLEQLGRQMQALKQNGKRQRSTAPGARS